MLCFDEVPITPIQPKTSTWLFILPSLDFCPSIEKPFSVVAQPTLLSTFPHGLHCPGSVSSSTRRIRPVLSLFEVSCLNFLQ